jgi:hypothetical protein
MKNKYALYCTQRNTYFGGESDIRDTSHFNSLNDIKEMLIEYHQDIEEEDHELLYKMGAVEIAEIFQWEIEEIKGESK